jgi:ATP-dependent HslUV protease subunit HslV
MSILPLKATTVVGVIHNGKAAIGGDGQATQDATKTVMKGTVKKVRRLYNGEIIAGFAGSTTDALTLYDKYEEKLGEYNGSLKRAAVEMAKEWRQDKFLRKLEALLIVMNKEHGLLISGQGDVIEPDDNILTIGSGGSYALAAARALKEEAPDLSAKQMVEKSLNIAADICIYTNHNLSILEID